MIHLEDGLLRPKHDGVLTTCNQHKEINQIYLDADSLLTLSKIKVKISLLQAVEAHRVARG
jgi:hypothetical protein